MNTRHGASMIQFPGHQTITDVSSFDIRNYKVKPGFCLNMREQQKGKERDTEM